MDDDGHVGQQAFGLQGLELGPGGERVAGATVAVSYPLGQMQDPGVDLAVHHGGAKGGAVEGGDRSGGGGGDASVEGVVVYATHQ
jgi:hypothetical protein